jgi:flagellar biosynthesis protein FlhA
MEASWNDVAPLDVLGLEVGYRLIPLVDKSQDGELLRRIRGIRKKFAQEVGFLVSPVHIRDNLELKPNAYRILLKGVEVGQGEAYTGQFLAINPGRVAGTLEWHGDQGSSLRLAGDLDRCRSAIRRRPMAIPWSMRATVVATHLNHLILTHAAELLGRQEVQQLLDHLAKEMPKLVEDLVPKVCRSATLQKVLQSCSTKACISATCEPSSKRWPITRRAPRMPTNSTQVRMRLGVPSSSNSSRRQRNAGHVARPALERSSRRRRRRLRKRQLRAGLADTLVRETAAASRAPGRLGLPAVLLVPASLRLLLSRFLRRTISQLKVLSHNEVPENRIIKVTSIIGGRT